MDPQSPPEAELSKSSSGKSLILAHSRLKDAWYPDCMICLVEQRQVRFDCGHLVACKVCTDRLLGQRGSCPVCRQPIGRTIFDGMPPLPGRQPTFEGKEIGLQRLVTTLAGDDAAAREEAAFLVCERAVEERASAFVDAGVIPPLVRLLALQGASLGRQAACCTIGILASSGADAVVLHAGGVPALLMLLGSESARGTPSYEYALLALAALVEHAGATTVAAIRSSPQECGGLQPLVDAAAGIGGATDAAACALSVLADLALVDARMREDVAKACMPLAPRLHQLRESGVVELQHAAAALESVLDGPAKAPPMDGPLADATAVKDGPSGSRRRKRCTVQ